MYKGHMDKAKGGWDWGWEVGMAGVGGSGGGKMETTVLVLKKREEEKQKNSNFRNRPVLVRTIHFRNSDKGLKNIFLVL